MIEVLDPLGRAAGWTFMAVVVAIRVVFFGWRASDLPEDRP